MSPLVIFLLIGLIILLLSGSIIFICFIGLYRKLIEIGNSIEEILEKINVGVEVGIKGTNNIAEEVTKTTASIREMKIEVSGVVGNAKDITNDLRVITRLIKTGTSSIIAYTHAIAFGVFTGLKTLKYRNNKNFKIDGGNKNE